MATQLRCAICTGLLGPEDLRDGRRPEACRACHKRAERNPHARAARFKKVMALVGAVDANALKQGINPHDQAGRIQLASLDWSPAAWELIAALAHANAPSAVSRDLVRDVYAARAKATPDRRLAS